MMIVLLLLLGASLCVGKPNDSYDVVEYGSAHRVFLHRSTHFIEFIPQYRSDVIMLWNRDNHSASADSRWKVMGNYYVINNITQRDNGRYIMRDQAQRMLSTKTIDVIARKMFYELRPGLQLNFTYDLEPRSCNIYFFPKSNTGLRGLKQELVRRGRLQKDMNHAECEGFDLLKPCGLVNKDVQMECSGHFEVRDQNDDKAVEVELQMEFHSKTVHYDPLYLGVGIGAVILLICCCVTRCCCKKSFSKKQTAAQSSLHQHEFNTDPAGQRTHQHSQPYGAHYPAQPFYSPTGPLIHSPPAMNVLPAHSEFEYHICHDVAT
uniref:uncharacterized protein LOC109974319 isoform X2 n=1 Tax=Monopterus albus TaxID=43700 RepID=UPI0009B2F579|nr:uncharacterized protein LOC109974319 isoform X2 [Monopterus albus]